MHNDFNKSMIWKELIKTALIGTDRTKLATQSKATLAGFNIDINQKESQLVLEAAAYYAMLHKAGYPLEAWTKPLVVPSPNSNEEICSLQSSRHLSLILGNYATALPEFVYHLVKAGKIIPPERLPILLDNSLKSKMLWDLVKEAIGERGRWLIQQNPAWKNLILHPDIEQFETGNREERLTIIKHLRNLNPPKALELIQSTWEEDDITTRKNFLKALETGLSLADEPWLESLLNHKRKEIREIASQLLTRIGESQLVKRTFERLKALMEYNAKKGKLVINLPSECSEEMIRDGIKPKLKWPGRGQKAGYLGQMLSKVPPGNWNDFFGQETDDCINLFLATEYPDIVFFALMNSTHLVDNEEWMEMILEYIAANFYDPFIAENISFLNLPGLLEKTPAKLYNDLILSCYEHEQELNDEGSLLFFLIRNAPRQLPNEIAKRVVEDLKARLAGEEYFYDNVQIKQLFKNLGYRLRPHLYDWVDKEFLSVSRSWGSLSQSIEMMLTTLKFRKDMVDEFEKSKPTK